MNIQIYTELFGGCFFLSDIIRHHFSTFWWFCHFLSLRKRWYFQLDDRLYTKRRLYDLVVSELLLLSANSKCRPCYLLILRRSIFLRWQKNWQKYNTSRFCVLYMFWGIFPEKKAAMKTPQKSVKNLKLQKVEILSFFLPLHGNAYGFMLKKNEPAMGFPLPSPDGSSVLIRDCRCSYKSLIVLHCWCQGMNALFWVILAG